MSRSLGIPVKLLHEAAGHVLRWSSRVENSTEEA
ncbi:hypothetical protein CK203_069503 [Vitis vinifera]|uniref:Uncharacterized protein n=1 Tax=Vitis vinifera TaxID=29760 RepID=A0A438EKK1_VITVI|nr:hypothetical protein CK203_069503 [Vitis vinifera]